MKIEFGELVDYLSIGEQEKIQNKIQEQQEIDDSIRTQITTHLHQRLDLSATDKAKLASTVTEALQATPNNLQTPHQVAQRLISAFEKQNRKGGQKWGSEEETELSRMTTSNLAEEWAKLCAFSPATFRPRTRAALLKKWQRVNNKKANHVV